MKTKKFVFALIGLVAILLLMLPSVSAEWVLVAGEYGKAYIEYDFESKCMHLHTPGYRDIFDNWHDAIDIYMYPFDPMEVYVGGIPHVVFIDPV
jgi:hypothetical protein